MIGEDINLNLVTGDAVKNFMADDTQIEQVLMNLVVNARQAMPNGGSLTIETNNVYFDEEYVDEHEGAKKGDYVMLSVSDTGHGMSEEIKAKIFEPFFTTKEEGKGTGLGLSTVYGIVKQHNGYITVDSETNRGASFKVFLPASSTGEIVRREKSREIQEGGSETILVVDDDFIARNMAVEALKSKGYKVLSADSGEAALKVTAEEKGGIDLLFTDMVMPGINGLELYKEIIKKRPDINVIFTTGYINNPDLYKAVYEDELPLLKKPYTPFALIEKIHEVLDK
jgi:CheY-like chemotaxis protein